jgi:hypothetical protein
MSLPHDETNFGIGTLDECQFAPIEGGMETGRVTDTSNAIAGKFVRRRNPRQLKK